jgi:hypothetical protein
VHLPKLIPPIHHFHTLHTPHTQRTQPLRSSLPFTSLPFLAFACIHDGLDRSWGAEWLKKPRKKMSQVTIRQWLAAVATKDANGAEGRHMRWSKGCPPRPSFCSSARSAMPWLLSLLPLASSDGGARRVGLTAHPGQDWPWVQ